MSVPREDPEEVGDRDGVVAEQHAGGEGGEQCRAEAPDDQPLPAARGSPGPADDVDGSTPSTVARVAASGGGRGQHRGHSAPLPSGRGG